MVVVFVLSMILLFVPRIQGDGRGYYAYIRSLAIDHDLDFTNEFSVYTDDPRALPNVEVKTVTGYVQNPWSVGPAILWIPFFYAAHLGTYILNLLGFSIPMDGYSLLYTLAASLGSVFYAFVGILLIYDLCRSYFNFSKFASLLATISVWLASSLTMYMYREPTLSHTFAFFAVSLFLYLFFFMKEGRTTFQWVVLGAVAGVMILVRWQTVAFLALPLFHSVQEGRYLMKRYNFKQIKGLVYQWLGFLVAIFAFFLPQAAAWKIIYGSYFLVPQDVLLPQGEAFMDWTCPHFLKVLFSPCHGLFTWTPVLLFALPGFFYLYKREKAITLSLLVAIILQVYINGCSKDWYGGACFGSRKLIEVLPVFILSLACWVDRFKTKLLVIVGSLIGALLLVWNLLFLVQYCRLLIPPMTGLTFRQMVIEKFQLPLKDIYLFFFAKYVKGIPALYGVSVSYFYLSVLGRVAGLALLSVIIGLMAMCVSQKLQSWIKKSRGVST
ncbi:MAG: hypothetical protein QMD08_06945 [Actinomycetota bacterium]|nr:hypothetical protein [Actinomycetota bacterium]